MQTQGDKTVFHELMSNFSVLYGDGAVLLPLLPRTEVTTSFENNLSVEREFNC